MSTGAVVVFAREPRPGRVKTRLASGVGARRAAAVYNAILDHTIETAVESGLRVILSFADAPSASWNPRDGVATEIQPNGDLGDRMADAFARRFGEGEERVVVIGSDCPFVTPELLSQSVTALSRGGVVLGPADDGGYWLVAQRAPGVDLFSGVSWSTRETLAQTRRRLEVMGEEWIELEELFDIDTVDDLDRVLTDPRSPKDLVDSLIAARSSETGDPKV